MSKWPLVVSDRNAPSPPEILAALAHVGVIVPQADSYAGHAPLWHGWAIRDTFLAGVEWARTQERQTQKEG